jgi:hypothetical protein
MRRAALRLRLCGSLAALLIGCAPGNATSGKVAFKFNADTTTYGARLPGYSSQKKEGAIILATGGDGSNTGTASGSREP